jgi:hypothetical protein
LANHSGATLTATSGATLITTSGDTFASGVASGTAATAIPSYEVGDATLSQLDAAAIVQIANALVENDFDPDIEFAEDTVGDDVIPMDYPHEINIRRGYEMEDFMAAFMQYPALVSVNLKVVIIGTNGKPENGQGVGALRDSITQFWSTFYDKCTLGSDAKVPCLRHDFEDAEWSAIARVFVKGFDVGYMPIKLAAPFLEEVLYG